MPSASPSWRSSSKASRAIYVAAELGIADRLAAGPLSSAELAEDTQAHEPSLYRVLRLLASLGVLAEETTARSV